MDIVLAIEFAALLLLLGLSAFFSSAETSLFSLSSAQLQQMRRDRNRRLGLIEELLSEPRRLIATILIGNEMVNVCASVLSATIILDLFGAGKSWLNIVIMVPVLLLFGEITPKTLALGNNVAFASFQSRYIDIFARVITPLRKVVRSVSEFFINLILSGERSQNNILTEDMVRSLTNAAVGEGSLDAIESQYIHQIFDFGNKTLSDVMTFRSQMVVVNETMSLHEVLAVRSSTRHSKLPVFSADGETVVGVLFARDALPLDSTAHGADGREELKRILRKPYFVPATIMAADLFVRMRERRTSLALVTDEFGGVTGMVTLEDLLECIFGELPSSSDHVSGDAPTIDSLGPGHYRASGALPIAEFNAVVGSEFELTGVATIGGLVLHACGEFPAQHTVVTIDNVEFTVTAITQQRILDVEALVTNKTTVEDSADDNTAASEPGDVDADASAEN